MKMKTLVCAVVAAVLSYGLSAYDGEAWRYVNLDEKVKKLDDTLLQAMESVACAGAELRSAYVNNGYCSKQLDAAWIELTHASNIIAQVKNDLRIKTNTINDLQKQNKELKDANEDHDKEWWIKWVAVALGVLVFCIVGGFVLLMVKATQKRPSVAPVEDDGHPRCPLCGWKYNKGETKCKNCGTRF